MRSVNLPLAALAAILGTLLVACPNATADTEPNEGLTQAEGPLKGGTTYAGTLSTENDYDWYVFYATSQAQLDIAVTNLDRDGRVELRDADGGYIDYTRPDKNEVGHIRYTTPPGTNRFYLSVSGSLSYKYEFRIDPGAAVVDGPKRDSATETSEPNESITQSIGPLIGATTYSGSIQTANDEDWFYFHTLGRREFDLSFLNTGPNGAPEVVATLFDRQGHEIQGISSDANYVSHFRRTSPTGITRYYVRIAGEAGTPWQLRIDPADALTTKPFEPCLEARVQEKEARRLYNLYVKRSHTASKKSTRRAYKKRSKKQKKKLDAASFRVALDCS